ncbi:putative salicylate hydroxylase [Hortaea werneckii]|uniref:FAD-binding domain-containing protein n=1 Tax=Hortaea werneckii TaxID=91943 RepID=A0A3M7F2F2_HORWE|nr:putative salicylate hydroxylase [Hortaea werneckii]KAI7563698.1 putative salicylate hydroxylase [Hortaea werneckii]KAI7612229.1 putative salicylate hydroxylase [Hortaea werneckii]KAI7633774.1 putative salicylate hydroxylase [Hortaea werneckii]KAI7660082.1 putative salicylate hydroxylase [Hortaea werneckii]
MTPEKPTIAIIGGGISGATLAIALIRRGINVTIYEQAHAFGEIGAGLAFAPNSIRAMQACSPDIYNAFQKVCATNQSPSKKNIWFEFSNSMDQTQEVGQEKHLFTLSSEIGANAVHRAHFLDELVKLIPEGVTQFKKHLDTIEQPSADSKVTMKFHDGTTAEADAVIGCDGIKARTRAWMLGDDHPGAPPVYTYKYAYRGLIPMERAVEALGEDSAKNSKMHLGKDGHVLTFPVDHGSTMNVVAFRTTDKDWKHPKLTVPSQKEHVYEDFKDFGPTVKKIIDMLEPNLDCWAIFDTGAHPMPAYNKGRVCCLGDAAHATSPHHGAGAGICIEDAAVMADLLADPQVHAAGSKGLAAAFQAFSGTRKERTQWLVQSSRREGDLYEWRADGVDDDFEKIHQECKQRCETIWDGQINDMMREAKSRLNSMLSI